MEALVQVDLSPAAAAKFVELFQASDRYDDRATLRLYVSGRGCCRAIYGLSYADELEPDDIVTEAGGIRLVIDGQNRDLYDGVSIDFVQSPEGEGFAVRGPKLTGGCTCGQA